MKKLDYSEIDLCGYKILLDTEDIPLVEAKAWHRNTGVKRSIVFDSSTWIPETGSTMRISLQKFLCPSGVQHKVVFKNGNEMDYRKCNLRRIIKAKY